MQVIEVSTDYADIRVVAKEDSQREWLMRHAIHRLIRQYKREYGADVANELLTELRSYHKVGEHA